METGDMVDAALAGLDQGERVTIPALPDISDWIAFKTARAALLPNISHRLPATLRPQEPDGHPPRVPEHTDNGRMACCLGEKTVTELLRRSVVL